MSKSVNVPNPEAKQELLELVLNQKVISFRKPKMRDIRKLQLAIAVIDQFTDVDALAHITEILSDGQITVEEVLDLGIEEAETLKKLVDSFGFFRQTGK